MAAKVDANEKKGKLKQWPWLPVPLPRGERKCRRGAYKLVELLVVVTIIGLLIALLVPAVRGALKAAYNLREEIRAHH